MGFIGSHGRPANPAFEPLRDPEWARFAHMTSRKPHSDAGFRRSPIKAGDAATLYPKEPGERKCNSRTRCTTASPRFCFSSRCRYTGTSSGTLAQTLPERKRWLTSHRRSQRLSRCPTLRTKSARRSGYAARAPICRRRRKPWPVARRGVWVGWLWWSASRARLPWSRNGRDALSAISDHGGAAHALRSCSCSLG